MVFGLFNQSEYFDLFDYRNISIVPNTRKYYNFRQWQKLCLAVKYRRTVCRFQVFFIQTDVIAYNMETNYVLYSGRRTGQILKTYSK
jgi:hypothetical protein